MPRSSLRSFQELQFAYDHVFAAYLPIQLSKRPEASLTSSLVSQHTEKNPVRYTSSSAATTPRQSPPLTPPTHPDLVVKTRHPQSSSVSSTSQYGCVPNPAPHYFTARSTTNLDLNQEREDVQSAESRGVFMPFTQPQYGLPSLYVTVPALQNMNNYYPTIVGKAHISDRVHHQQPLLNVGLPLLDAL
ncbi:hypothetical protein V500_02717 [Pseudogymnoascus sp. VKM F-4518 (FW-2643)]|nr:hypothetical protein V500_02717 [Pseudogymnoascus sp. VKM F-4518 (FW-2643)]